MAMPQACVNVMQSIFFKPPPLSTFKAASHSRISPHHQCRDAPQRRAHKISRNSALPKTNINVADADGSDYQADIERDIDASTAAVDEMVRQVTKSLFVETATAYVTGDAKTKEHVDAALKNAVTPRLDSFNSTLLPILNSYIEAVQERSARQEGQNDVLGVLLGLKSEILSQLAERLPPEMRTIQLAVEASGPDGRMTVLRDALLSTSASSPINVDMLKLTVSRMIEDFEGDDDDDDDDAAIPDRALLAKLCLLREELRQLSEEAGMKPGGLGVGGSTSGGQQLDVTVVEEEEVEEEEEEDNDATTSSRKSGCDVSPYTALRGVPAREVSFLKQLMTVGSSEKRRALLETVFGGKDKSGVARGVRAGALMECIKALQVEMMGPVYAEDDSGRTAGALMRLEEIWRDAVLVLEDVGGDATYSP